MKESEKSRVRNTRLHKSVYRFETQDFENKRNERKGWERRGRRTSGSGRERKIKDTKEDGGDGQQRCRCIERIRGTRGRRCNKASRERNTPRRLHLPLELQSSSISRGRQIKLLTQYPLYPYNKNKYDPQSPNNRRLRFLHLFLILVVPHPHLAPQRATNSSDRECITHYFLLFISRL